MSDSIRSHHIGFSPLSERVFVYRGKSGVAESKADRTSEFIAALLEWCTPGFRREIKSESGKRYEVTVKEVRR